LFCEGCFDAIIALTLRGSIAVVLGNATTKSSHGKNVHDLRKDEFALKHEETSQGTGEASLFEI
jgi:hypothetical protein